MFNANIWSAFVYMINIKFILDFVCKNNACYSNVAVGLSGLDLLSNWCHELIEENMLTLGKDDFMYR